MVKRYKNQGILDSIAVDIQQSGKRCPVEVERETWSSRIGAGLEILVVIRAMTLGIPNLPVKHFKPSGPQGPHHDLTIEATKFLRSTEIFAVCLETKAHGRCRLNRRRRWFSVPRVLILRLSPVLMLRLSPTAFKIGKIVLEFLR